MLCMTAEQEALTMEGKDSVEQVTETIKGSRLVG